MDAPSAVGVELCAGHGVHATEPVWLAYVLALQAKIKKNLVRARKCCGRRLVGTYVREHEEVGVLE